MSIGVPYELFWRLNPKKLNPFREAHKRKIEEQDLFMHAWWGSYGLSAVSVAVEHCLHGKKAKSKYIEKPIISTSIKEKEENDRPLTEEEKRKQTEQLFMKLRIMGANHKLANKDSSVS